MATPANWVQPPPPRTGWSGRKKLAVAAGVVLLILVAAAAARGPSAPGGPAGTSQTAVATPAPPEGSVQPTLAAPTLAEATLSATVAPITPAPTPDLFADVNRSGRGSRVETFDKPMDTAAIAVIEHNGSRNFIVTSIASDGSDNELLVNVIGVYSGTVLFDIGSDSAALQIEADGRWQVSIRHVAKARVWNPASALSGQGDDVVRVVPAPTGLTTVELLYRGSRNFIVRSYGDAGTDLLANEVGQFSGQTLLPAGTVLLQVTADGRWSVTAE